ncbi:SEC-C metal-binding domain-containing protein [Robertmurraya kyonggiensis]|uniref:SEC-C motif-containing protein n=1 Tax=Robertmurraya kyonggiensis TaxID=1037680 RepID=A0A4U1D641_9BACI|nr:SEC-C metal-binding domain-containing protein [Robertmurraya kyonggiensis]TKC18042.1 hypothetical protein FA727_00270 [Robertmurraya kyonggiensis]
MDKALSKIDQKMLLNALQKATEDTEKMIEKQYDKHWSKLNVPFTLQEGLSTYTKYELDTIRKKHKIANVSNLKKAELVSVMQERIPNQLENICLLWDLERYQLLMSIAENGGQIEAPDLESNQVIYLRETGLIYSGIFEGKNILAVPNELIEPIKALKSDIKLNEIVSRNSEWIKLTTGLLYYYGTLSGAQILDMMEKYMNEPRLKEYLYVIEDASSYRKIFKRFKDGFLNIRGFDPEKIQQEHQMRRELPYYPFTKQQLLLAGEPGFVEKNQGFIQLVNFITMNFDISNEEAEALVAESVFATRIGESPNFVMKFLSQSLIFDDMDTVKALMDKVVYLMNNTKQWFLKGYTPIELRPLQKPVLKPDKNVSEKELKIGRNDPCPCGSGKKYKKCCGQ